MRKSIPTVVLFSLLLLITFSVVVFSYGIVFTDKLPDWVGTKEYIDSTGKVISKPKTFWDLMALLIIPASLSIIAFLLNRSEREAEARRDQTELSLERKISDNRNQEENLLNYINRLNDLIIEKICLALIQTHLFALLQEPTQKYWFTE
jgi:hypothetical protein